MRGDETVQVEMPRKTARGSTELRGKVKLPGQPQKGDKEGAKINQLSRVKKWESKKGTLGSSSSGVSR